MSCHLLSLPESNYSLVHTLWSSPSSLSVQSNQLSMWHEYLGYEKSNPQGLDPQSLTQRVALAYDQVRIGIGLGLELGSISFSFFYTHDTRAVPDPLQQAS